MMKEDFYHVSVLHSELVEAISHKENGLYCDMTFGGGGHSSLLLETNKNARLSGIDRDQMALDAAKHHKERFGDRLTLVHNNFSNIKSVMQSLSVDGLDGIMADLGVSSPQLDMAERGFSYQADAPLDMRMDMSQNFCAKDVVNTYSQKALCDIISTYGEERWAKRIAQFIADRRPIETTGQLVEAIKAAVPAGARKDGPHPAKRTFQAIRIEVNAELESIRRVIEDAVSLLKPGGRIAIITFHSLEDRIVKQEFARLSTGCECPKEFPVCVCNKKPVIKQWKKPILPSDEEIELNPRARSAKLRVAEKL